jgi:hypothetical protein
MAIAAGAGGGCRSLIGSAPGGSLQVTSVTQPPTRLGASLQTAIYSHDPLAATTIMLADVPPQRLLEGDFREAQVFHVELLWRPKPGSTPVDRTATNISIRHVIFSGGQVGVYGGAGFAIPAGDPGDRSLSIEIRDASLRLLDATPGFADLLSPAQLTGRLTVRHDRAQTRRLHLALSQLVSTGIGKSLFVEAPHDGSAASARDLHDPHAQQRLAMPHAAAVPLAALVGEDADLVAQHLADDLGAHRRAIDVGRADDGVALSLGVAHQEHARELDAAALARIRVGRVIEPPGVQVDLVAGPDLDLRSTVLDDRVHGALLRAKPAL